MKIITEITRTILGLFFAAMLLGVGGIPLFLYYKTQESEQQVQKWNTAPCLVVAAKEGTDIDFNLECEYFVNGQKYGVKNETPSWNPYYSQVTTKNEKLMVTLRDSRSKTHFYTFEVGKPTTIWYEPTDPANSVLIPYASSLNGFLYFGFLYIFVLIGAIFWGWKSSLTNKVQK
jgi:hypothetical protein